MNILPKKSWHVRNKNNIERVRRDEEKAANEEIERQRRIALAESEARTDLLRVRTKKRRHDDTSDQKTVVQSSSKHINFFEDLELGKKLGGKNAEHEEEKKKEKEAQEKSIGLLTYLGQGSVELNDEKPWYYKAPVKQASAKASDLAKDEVDTKRKRSQDPLSMMDKYVSVTKKVEDAKQGITNKFQKAASSRSSSSTDSATRPRAAKTIEELRAERVAREKQERLREQQLLARRSGDIVRDERLEIDERSMRYNSQFNPDFVRRPKHSAHTRH